MTTPMKPTVTDVAAGIVGLMITGAGAWVIVEIGRAHV